MSSVVASAMEQLQAMSALEGVAVLLAIAYLVLAVRENIWCWACAFVSTALYILLFYQVSLLSESLLNVFYLVMAVYGYHCWRTGGQAADQLPITRRSTAWHIKVLLVTGTCVPVLGWVMANQFNASMPYLDAFTSCFAVVTTWMVTQKILENWLYWFVIDSVSIYLYLEKGLTLTAWLFVLYLVLIVFGYRRWANEFRRDPLPVTA